MRESVCLVLGAVRGTLLLLDAEWVDTGGQGLEPPTFVKARPALRLSPLLANVCPLGLGAPHLLVTLFQSRPGDPALTGSWFAVHTRVPGSFSASWVAGAWVALPPRAPFSGNESAPGRGSTRGAAAGLGDPDVSHDTVSPVWQSHISRSALSDPAAKSSAASLANPKESHHWSGK